MDTKKDCIINTGSTASNLKAWWNLSPSQRPAAVLNGFISFAFANPFHLQLLWPVKEKIDYPPLCNPVSFPEHGFSCAPHEAPRHEQRMFSNGMNPSASQLPACVSPPVPIHTFSAVMCPDLSHFPFCYYLYTHSLPFLQYLSQSLSFHCSCNIYSFE